MTLDLIVNAFAYLGLSPKSTNKDIIMAVMRRMKEDPNKMRELAAYQAMLLKPEARFLIELLYYPDFSTLGRERIDDRIGLC